MTLTRVWPTSAIGCARSAENAHAILNAWSSNPFAPPWRRMAAYYELVALAGFTHARPDYGIDSVERNGEPIPVEEQRRLVDAVLPVAALSPRGRRGRSEDPSGRADVRPFRDAAARHDPHAAARPSGLHHRLDQPAQRQARARQLRARRLHPAPDRFRRLHRRRLPCRGGLPADGLGARRDRGAGAGRLQHPARQPDADGGTDRRAHRADQGQRTRAGEADRMVPHAT